MSGGFFRGTSADQDTRFSNKQAKLMKSQKFAPELENLVDMTKVKMDVMRPWIATRVTELIGFEDEVLINFIYTLMEEKVVNGKQLQISLTGFMERNTGKFMKELWALLLSAQQTASGVPQQFLDAKEEETKKKKAETDRVANEIRTKREKDKQDLYQEKTKMDGNGEMSRERHSMLELNEKHDQAQPTVEKERPKRNGTRGRSRVSRSSGSASRSPSPSKRRSRSISASPKSRSRSISSERQRRSSPRRSVTPRRRHSRRPSSSPPRRPSPHSRKRSTSRTRQRSPSPRRYRVRSTWRYRSRSPLRHRSRSPRRHRSRSPVRRRSPSANRDHSASPVRRGSPPAIRRRGSPPAIRRRSPSPYGRGPPSERRQSQVPTKRLQSPSNSPKRSTSPVPRKSSINDRDKFLTHVPVRSSSDESSSSPSPTRRRSISPIRRGSPRRIARSPLQAPRRKIRSHIEYSSARGASPIERTESLPKIRNALQSVESKSVVSLRSPQRDSVDQNDFGGKGRHLPPSMENSKSVSDASRGRRHTGDRRSTSPRGSPYARREGMIRPESLSTLPKADGSKPRSDGSGTRLDDRDNISRREIGEPKLGSLGKVSPSFVQRSDSLDSTEIRGLTDEPKSRKTESTRSDKQGNRVEHKEHSERQKLSTIHEAAVVSKKGREPSHRDGVNDKNRARDDRKGSPGFPEQESLPKTSKNSVQNAPVDSTPNRSDEDRIKGKEKRKDRKLDRQEADSDGYSSSDSHEERREAKKRRKEEKKLKKEERRRRREERRRRKEERRSEKKKLKSVDAGSSSSDYEQDHSEDGGVRRRDSRSKNQDAESQQKKLEIELREKALKSLRAKRGIGN